MKSGRLVLVAVCLILAPGAPATAVADGATRNIVVLASRDSQQPAYEQFMSGFRAGLSGTLPPFFTNPFRALSLSPP
jgi:hypothetical protein